MGWTSPHWHQREMDPCWFTWTAKTNNAKTLLHFIYDTCKLYLFPDASAKAYGAVVYMSQQDQVCLVMSKSWVAPTKSITLLKLELMAAVMAARLANFVKPSLYNYDLSTNIPLWSDSQIALYCIYKQTSSKPPLCHWNCQVPPNMWSFTPTLDNPISLLEAYQLSNYLLHSYGLKAQAGYCQNPSGPNGCQQVSYISILQKQGRRKDSLIHLKRTPAVSNAVTITRYSSINKLLAVTAYVLRFIHNLSKQHARLNGPLSVSELRSAKKLWISSSQHLYFKDELSYLLKKQHFLPWLNNLDYSWTTITLYSAVAEFTMPL